MHRKERTGPNGFHQMELHDKTQCLRSLDPRIVFFSGANQQVKKPVHKAADPHIPPKPQQQAKDAPRATTAKQMPTFQCQSSSYSISSNWSSHADDSSTSLHSSWHNSDHLCQPKGIASQPPQSHKQHHHSRHDSLSSNISGSGSWAGAAALPAPASPPAYGRDQLSTQTAAVLSAAGGDPWLAIRQLLADNQRLAAEKQGLRKQIWELGKEAAAARQSRARMLDTLWGTNCRHQREVECWRRYSAQLRYTLKMTGLPVDIVDVPPECQCDEAGDCELPVLQPPHICAPGAGQMGHAASAEQLHADVEHLGQMSLVNPMVQTAPRPRASSGSGGGASASGHVIAHYITSTNTGAATADGFAKMAVECCSSIHSLRLAEVGGKGALPATRTATCEVTSSVQQQAATGSCTCCRPAAHSDHDQVQRALLPVSSCAEDPAATSPVISVGGRQDISGHASSSPVQRREVRVQVDGGAAAAHNIGGDMHSTSGTRSHSGSSIGDNGSGKCKTGGKLAKVAAGLRAWGRSCFVA